MKEKQHKETKRGRETKENCYVFCPFPTPIMGDDINKGDVTSNTLVRRQSRGQIPSSLIENIIVIFT